MSRLAGLATGCAHRRRIDMSTYPVDDTHILSTGKFIEERLEPYYKITGERVESGPLHNLEILMLVRIPEMVIEDIEVLTGTLPRQDCHDVVHSLEPVIGLAIKGGFSAKVKELAGGIKGCTHLVHLLCTMAPAVMQGFWALSYRNKRERDKNSVSRAERMGTMLKNSCYSWREDGSAYQKIMSYVNSKK